jgi:hypothetical protein
LKQEHYRRSYQQNMYQTASKVQQETNEPQNKQYRNYRIKHLSLLLTFVFACSNCYQLPSQAGEIFDNLIYPRERACKRNILCGV